MEHQVLRVLKALCREVGTPRALTVQLLASNGEWTQLQELRVEPRRYLCASTYHRDAIVTEFLRKCELPGDHDRKYQAAVRTFWECETQNARTNVRLSRFIENGPFEASDEPVVRFVTAWRQKVRKVLGRLPVELTPRFSGGATYADKSQLATPPDKMTSQATYYTATSALMPFFWQTAWGRVSLNNAPSTVRGNIFFTVPKDGTKYRGCCKEASVSVSLQLDCDVHLKRRLRACGYDLKTGQDLHRDLARESSITRHRATLDMSNASDTLAYKLVELAVPSEWFNLFSSLRAPFTNLDGKWVKLEKFSSMGNGFTFTLETLIFATLAETVCELRGDYPEVYCYGDDLIVPTDAARDVLAALAFFGFTPNERKSYHEGDFRESCGGDYYAGTPVRAHYLEKPPNEPHEWISLANGLRRLPAKWAHTAWVECIKNIPNQIRQCRGPESLGDIVLHDYPGAWELHVRTPKGEYNPCVYYRAWVPVPVVLPWQHWKPPIQYAGALLGLPSEGVTPRKSVGEAVSGYRLGWVREPGNAWLPQSGVEHPHPSVYAWERFPRA